MNAAKLAGCASSNNDRIAKVRTPSLLELAQACELFGRINLYTGGLPLA
jgi:hypothetical protein